MFHHCRRIPFAHELIIVIKAKARENSHHNQQVLTPLRASYGVHQYIGSAPSMPATQQRHQRCVLYQLLTKSVDTTHAYLSYAPKHLSAKYSAVCARPPLQPVCRRYLRCGRAAQHHQRQERSSCIVAASESTFKIPRDGDHTASGTAVCERCLLLTRQSKSTAVIATISLRYIETVSSRLAAQNITSGKPDISYR